MDNNTYKIYECAGIGDVNVSREVVAGIAGIAATEVDGVDSLSNNITRENVSRVNGKSLASAIKISNSGKEIDVTISLVVKNGFLIPEVSGKVQENVKSAIEGMTGIKVGTIDIEIINLKVEK